MKQKAKFQVRVDDEGRLVLPREVVSRLGLRPGVQIGLDDGENYLRFHPPITHLAKVYIEPTNACNLECRTCVRNVWNEPIGQMSSKTFDRILEGLKKFSPKPTVFFGGFGEPLAHPAIAEMVGQVKALGGSTELITNGTLLTRETSRQLIEAGLDKLWVSLDGAKPESYTDVRLGAALPEVILNLAGFRDACPCPDYFFSLSYQTQNRHRVCSHEKEYFRSALCRATWQSPGSDAILDNEYPSLHRRNDR